MGKHTTGGGRRVASAKISTLTTDDDRYVPSVFQLMNSGGNFKPSVSADDSLREFRSDQLRLAESGDLVAQRYVEGYRQAYANPRRGREIAGSRLSAQGRQDGVVDLRIQLIRDMRN